MRPGIVHALEPAFVPWATPYEPWLLWQLAQHPKFIGGKISTLDEPHFLYWAAMCRDLRLDFAPHSGDDFGIATAIKVGLPLLIGAASSAAPLICAAKAMWWGEPFDTRVYKLFEAIQSLEDAVFRLDARGSAAAYKHSTAHVLHALGVIAAPEPHPACADTRSGTGASGTHVIRQAKTPALRGPSPALRPPFRLCSAANEPPPFTETVGSAGRSRSGDIPVADGGARSAKSNIRRAPTPCRLAKE